MLGEEVTVKNYFFNVYQGRLVTGYEQKIHCEGTPEIDFQLKHITTTVSQPGIVFLSKIEIQGINLLLAETDASWFHEENDNHQDLTVQNIHLKAGEPVIVEGYVKGYEEHGAKGRPFAFRMLFSAHT